MLDGPVILVVEDEPDIQELICYHLEREHFATVKASTGDEALHIIKTSNPSLVLLDLMLPGISGIEVLKTIRYVLQLATLPVIIVSARTDESDIITGLELGADNYLPKPFNPKILVANVKALLRRAAASGQTDIADVSQIVSGHLRLDAVRHEAFWNDDPVLLTATEFAIMELFAKNVGRVFTRNQLISALRGESYPVTERSVDVQIASLRRKLNDGQNSIKTVWGIGYSFQDTQ